MSETGPVQRYGPTSGTVTGVVGLASCAVVVGAVVVGGLSPTSVRVGLAGLALAVLIWAYLLRPSIVVEPDGHTLLLRNPLVSHRIPIAVVKSVVVRAITTVRTHDDDRFDAVAVGYPLRKIARGHATEGAGRDRIEVQTLMVDRILAAADRARTTEAPVGPVERRYAVVEIGLLVALVIAFAVSFAF